MPLFRECIYALKLQTFTGHVSVIKNHGETDLEQNHLLWNAQFQRNDFFLWKGSRKISSLCRIKLLVVHCLLCILRWINIRQKRLMLLGSHISSLLFLAKSGHLPKCFSLWCWHFTLYLMDTFFFILESLKRCMIRHRKARTYICSNKLYIIYKAVHKHKYLCFLAPNSIILRTWKKSSTWLLSVLQIKYDCI